MNEKNLEYLKENLKYLGFGDKLTPELERNLQQGHPAFQLRLLAEYNQEKMQVQLHFRKSDTSDLVFLNRYEAILERRNGEVLSQIFYIYKGSGLSAKEAYNLLEGRSVFKELYTKEGAQYRAWILLDFIERDANGNFKFKQFHENYGYDLAATLGRFSIKEMQGEEVTRDILLKSLQRGNLQSVTMDKGELSERVFIEANPQFKTINFYDARMQKMSFHDMKEKYGLNLPDKKEKESVSDSHAAEDLNARQMKEKITPPTETKKQRKKKGLSLK